ncbi:hypothetical protein HGRIS_011827 [Hohenbuehelia grisea]|uniref:F-box domain-containing protein n=1 Tax=Hohenbuehelia grisea TaxID=104357 RepID=A0ABR3JYH4_9AGAR
MPGLDQLSQILKGLRRDRSWTKVPHPALHLTSNFFMFTFQDLPIEVVEHVLEGLKPSDLTSVALVSRALNALAENFLYRAVYFSSVPSAGGFLRAVARNESKVVLVRSLHWEFHLGVWHTIGRPKVFNGAVLLLKNLETLRLVAHPGILCNEIDVLPRCKYPKLKSLEYGPFEGRLGAQSLSAFVDLHPSLTTLKLPLYTETPASALYLPELEIFSGPATLLPFLSGATRLSTACLLTEAETHLDADQVLEELARKSSGLLKELGCISPLGGSAFFNAAADWLPGLQHFAIYYHAEGTTEPSTIVKDICQRFVRFKSLVTFQYAPLSCLLRSAPVPHHLVPLHRLSGSSLRYCSWFGYHWRWEDNTQTWEKIRATHASNLVPGLKELAEHYLS